MGVGVGVGIGVRVGSGVGVGVNSGVGVGDTEGAGVNDELAGVGSSVGETKGVVEGDGAGDSETAGEEVGVGVGLGALVVASTVLSDIKGLGEGWDSGFPYTKIGLPPFGIDSATVISGVGMGVSDTTGIYPSITSSLGFSNFPIRPEYSTDTILCDSPFSFSIF